MVKNLIATVRILTLGIAISSLLSLSATAQYSGQFSWGNSNLHETTLTPQNVNSTSFGKVFSYQVDGQIYAQPLYIPNVTIPGQGVHNVLYVETENDSAYAFDADGLSTNPLWYVSFINPAQGITAVPCKLLTQNTCNISPIVGITGTPAIDPVSGTIYLDTHIDNNGTMYHYLHALDITTGAEKFGGPVMIQASVKGKGIDSSGGFVPFDANHTLQRPGLLLMNGVIYIPYGNYHGWVMGYNAQTLAQLYVLNTSPNNENSNIWQSGEGLIADSNNNIYFSTSDAKFDVNSSGLDYGDTLIKVNSSLQIVDYFTPMDQACRGGNDVDLGSGGPLMLPTQPGPYPDEIVFGGKGGTPCDLWTGGVYAAPLYVINYASLGHYNATQDQIPQEIEGAPFGYWSSPAYWTNGTTGYVYAAGTQADAGVGDYMKQYTLSNGQLVTPPTAMSPSVLPDGATPAISANGTSNGIVWVAERQESLDTNPGKKPVVLQAYSASNIGTLLYSSTQNPSRDTAGLESKFIFPLVANGRVYLGTQTEVDVYGPIVKSNVTLTPTSMTWGTVFFGATGAAKTATLTNGNTTSITISSVSVTGTASSQYPISANTCGSTLAAGASCTISVQFKPTVEGTQSATLTVVDSGGTQTSALSGYGSAIKFNPASLTFGSTADGSSSAPQVTNMTNLTGSTLTITSIAIGGANPTDYTETNNCGTSLASGASCAITVTFTPNAIGSLPANVTVTDSDSVTSPQKVVLNGTGAQPQISYTVTPSSIAFPTDTVGLQSSCQPVVVTNTGSSPVTISSFTLTPFLIFQLQYGYAPRTLSASQTQTYCIKFVPTAATNYTGQISISIAGVSTPSIVTFTGTGKITQAVGAVTTPIINFPATPLGSTSTQTVTITNTGKSAYHLTGVVDEPPFSFTGYSGGSIAVNPNASYSFQVTFTPTQATSYTNAVYMTSDLIPGMSASLNGTGVAPTSLAITNFPTLPYVNQKATYLANLAAAGGTGNLTWSVASGSALPSGLVLSSAGQITGTPAASVAVGNYTFTAQVTDQSTPPKTATATLTLPVAAYVTGAKCSNIDWDVAGTSNPLVALPDLGTGTYLGFEGGLYPNGQNTPPASQLTQAMTAAQNIANMTTPVFMSVGVSITRTEWDEFGPMEQADPAINPNLVLVNAAIDGTNAPDWTASDSGTWLSITNYYLPYQNVTANQVAAAWLMMPASNQSGTYPGDMANQENDLISILQDMHTYFPNLQIVYISSLHYGGYQPSNSYPEPYAYEFGLAVQNVIADQIDGNSALNNNPANGPVVAPLVLWGPYMWENGLLGRSDGLTWDCQDVTSDGLHPSALGRNKAAGLLTTFFKTDPTATPWYLAPSSKK